VKEELGQRGEGVLSLYKGCPFLVSSTLVLYSLDGTLPTYARSSAHRCDAEFPYFLKLDVSQIPSPAGHTTSLTLQSPWTRSLARSLSNIRVRGSPSGRHRGGQTTPIPIPTLVSILTRTKETRSLRRSHGSATLPAP